MEQQVYNIKGTHSILDISTYQNWYQASLKTPEIFWGEQANKWVTWFNPWEKVYEGDLKTGKNFWFPGAKLNLSYNCLDRHLSTRANQIALIWQGDEEHETKQFTYQALYEQVSKFANVLKAQGIKKHDRVWIYLPMIPEALIAILACARIGAIHSVVFAGFSSEALKTRLIDADCRLLITSNVSIRGGKKILLKESVDQALTSCANVKTVVVVKRDETKVDMTQERDFWFDELMKSAPSENEPEWMLATDPLFILYTSGSTGKPKGILHATGGYAVYTAMTFKIIFDYRDNEVFWCTADVGWITGHSYVVYGPLLNGATTLMFEGVPHYPSFSRFWQIVDKFKVNQFYTAPTALRALRREGDEWVRSTKRTSLRILGSVGEPINHEAWEWYFNCVGRGLCPIVDTWWQTETGGIVISPIPYLTPLKPGAATKPFFGIAAEIVDDQGEKVAPNTMGHLVINNSWPGIMSTIYGNEQRYLESYLEKFPGKYLTGDEARMDEDHDFWIAGREDDVIKVSGHRIGSQEVESALILHPAVSESAVVPMEDPIKGQSICAFVSLKKGEKESDELKQALIQQVRKEIGAIATIKEIIWVEGLPKTRSGKIMRRILKKIANRNTKDLGDLSTLADPEVVKEIIARVK